ncbi:glycosyltransferase [Terrimicrobium sacchariphilum]|uniref:Glycosyltransferase n=1 Tax=Terrimicrobium sacchariphilum TaxID=690879 RepID=A0A146G2P1_TERSA|nr:glycosyltransferase [Terrimicrobium sacchariphilum]GAT31753.1 glycosyltransferase [Terrimicrobium sacchariphilum]
MMNKTNIVYILRAPAPYWISGLDGMTTAWQDLGETHLICAELHTDSLHPWKTDYLKPKKTILHHCPPRHRIFGTPWPSWEMWKLLNQINPQVVVIHEFSPYAVFSGMAWAKAHNRLCILSTDVGPVKQQEFSSVHRFIQKSILSLADGVIARTPDARNYGQQLSKETLLAPHAISILPFAIEETTPRKCRPSKRRLLQVGCLIPCKGVDLLLAAFAEVVKVNPDVELVLLGSGDKEHVSEIARTLRIENYLIFKEFLQPPEVVLEYRAADAFVLASRLDTYGVVVHEAAASGLPLVISKFAGASETLVQEGKNGYVIDPYDTKTFSARLLEVLKETNHDRFRRESLQLAKEFDVESLGKQTRKWIEHLLFLKKPPQLET